MRTGNLAAVMRTMGHRDVKTAMHYQHPELEIVRAALDCCTPNDVGKHGHNEKGITTPFESHPKNSNDGKSLTTEANVDENKSLAVYRPLFGQFNLRNLKKNRGSGEGPYARMERGRCGKAHKKAHKTPDLGCFAMTYGVVRTFQVIQNT
jgi:hypothetical protein